MAFARKGFFQAKQTRGSVEEIGQSSKNIPRSYRPIDGPFPKSFLARTKHTQYRRQTLSVAPAHFSPFVISSCYVPYAVVVPRKFLFLLCFSFFFQIFVAAVVIEWPPVVSTAYRDLDDRRRRRRRRRSWIIQFRAVVYGSGGLERFGTRKEGETHTHTHQEENK